MTLLGGENLTLFVRDVKTMMTNSEMLFQFEIIKRIRNNRLDILKAHLFRRHFDTNTSFNMFVRVFVTHTSALYN